VGRKPFFHFIAVLLAWVFFGPNLGWAQAPVPLKTPLAEPQTAAKESDFALNAWLAHREFLARGEWEKSREELEKIYQWKLDQGIRNHYPFSIALVRESKRQNGNSAAAAELLNYAAKMAPDFSEVPRARAGWLWSQIPNSWENATQAVLTWGEGVWRSFANPEEALPQLAAILLLILTSFLLALGGFALFLFLRYHSFFAHHLKHLVRIEMTSVPAKILSILFLFSPLFLGLGWMWTPVLWLLVFWVYARKPDRKVAVVLLFLLLLLPSGIRFHSSLLLSGAGNGVPEILRAGTGEWNEDFYRRILEMNQSRPEDRDLLQAVGLVEKRMGKFPEAERRFTEMARLDPDSGPAYNNLGNVYLVTNRPDQAMEAYRRAAQLEPGRGEAYYNLGQAYLLKLRMKEAEAEFQKAKTLQPSSISYYTSISSRHPNRLVIDRNFDLRQVWRRILASTPEREAFARSLWGILWGGVPLEYGEIAFGAVFLLLAMVHLFSSRMSFVRNCDRCGKIICSRCTRSRVIGSQCVQCLNAFSANASADPAGVKKKRKEVARHQAWQISFPQRISLFLPGSGHLMRGNSREGVFFLFLFALFLTQVFFRLKQFPAPVVSIPGFSWPWAGLTAFLFLLFYILVQYRMAQLRSKGGNSHFRKP
jgi:tetratricopeptide (TPR) repeat protein